MPGPGKPRDCALAFPSDKCAPPPLAFPPPPPPPTDEVRILCGRRIGYPENTQIKFFWTNASNDFPPRPFVGIRINFPAKRVDDVSSSDPHGLPTTEYSITIKLWHGTFISSGRTLTPAELARFPPRIITNDDELSVLLFTLKDGEVPYIYCAGKGIGSIDMDAKIDGIMSLRGLARQRRFEVIVSNFDSRLDSINMNLENHFSSHTRPGTGSTSADIEARPGAGAGAEAEARAGVGRDDRGGDRGGGRGGGRGGSGGGSGGNSW